MLSENTTWCCHKQYLYSQNDVNVNYLINDNHKTLWKGRMRRNVVISPVKSAFIRAKKSIYNDKNWWTEEQQKRQALEVVERDSCSFTINSIFFSIPMIYVLFGYKMKMHYTSIYRYNLRQLVKCSVVEETSLSVSSLFLHWDRQREREHSWFANH